MENKRFCDLVKEDKLFIYFEGNYTNEIIEKIDYIEGYFRIKTDLDDYFMDLESKKGELFIIVTDDLGIVLAIATSLDRLLLETSY